MTYVLPRFRNNYTGRVYWSLLIAFFSVLFTSGSKSQEIIFVGQPVPPLILTNANGQKSGALVELAQALIDYARIDASIAFLPWARAYEMGLNEPNVILLSLLKTEHREPLFQWIGKVHQAKAHLIGMNNRSDISVTDLEQAKKLRIGSVRGYGSANYLIGRGFDEQVNLVLSANTEQMWGLLFGKRIDLVLSNYETSSFEIKSAGFDPLLVADILEITELSNELQFATSLKTPVETVNVLSIGLSKLKKNGTYSAIKQKWNLPTE